MEKNTVWFGIKDEHTRLDFYFTCVSRSVVLLKRSNAISLSDLIVLYLEASEV